MSTFLKHSEINYSDQSNYWYDGHTLEPQMDQVKELTGGKIRKAIVDRGYRVKGGIRGVEIVMPKNLKKESYYLKRKREERCRSRAG